MILLLGCVTEALPLGSTAEDCGSCHTSHFAEWETSGHGTSGGSPVFSAMLPRVEDAWGGFARQSCEGCHTPGHGGDTTIGCVSCHVAVGNHAERDGLLAVDLDAPLAGPVGMVNQAHATTQRGFLTSDSLCGTCHEVTGPELLVEDTLGEHRDSPSAGEGCLGCHAPDGEHTFVGFDPRWDDVADPEAAAATAALLGRALSLRVEGDEVVVTNVGEGHSVPTGVSFLRDIWVEVDDSRVLTIGDQPTRGGEPVALLTDADSGSGGDRPLARPRGARGRARRVGPRSPVAHA